MAVDHFQVRGRDFAGLERGDELGEIALDQGLLLGHRRSPQEDLLQLRHVAGPGVLEEPVHDLPRDAMESLPELLVDELDEVIHEQRDVLKPIPQGRYVEGDYVEPVVEIVSEGPLLDHAPDVPVRRGDDPGVERELVTAPDPFEFPRFEDPQEAGLQVEGQRGDLVQVERAVAGLFEFARLAARGARVGAFLVAEQLGLQDLFGEAVAVDDHVGLVFGREVVEGLSQERLACSRLAQDEYRAVLGSDHHDLVEEDPDALALADEFREENLSLHLAQQIADLLENDVELLQVVSLALAVSIALPRNGGDCLHPRDEVLHRLEEQPRDQQRAEEGERPDPQAPPLQVQVRVGNEVRVLEDLMGRDDGQQGDPAEDDRDEDVETDVEARVFHGIPTLCFTTTGPPGPCRA